MPAEDRRAAWEVLRTNPNVTAGDVHRLLSQMGEAELLAFLTETLPGAPDLQRKIVAALVGAADTLIRRKDLESAVPPLDLAESVGKAVANPWALAQVAYWRGELEMARGHPEAAAGFFERAVDGAETTPERVVALYNAGRAWHSAGKL